MWSWLATGLVLVQLAAVLAAKGGWMPAAFTLGLGY